jgi:hypothetical protein
LRAVHLIRRSGERVTLSRIGHRAWLPNNRLKARLAELHHLGLLNADLSVTPAGYDYCEDYTRHVDYFMRKYGLDRKHWNTTDHL